MMALFPASHPTHILACNEQGPAQPGVQRIALPNGVTYYGDELGPINGAPGGSYYRFIPAHPWAGGAPITSLADSPLAAGSVSVLKVGQGTSQGIGTGGPVPPAPPTGSLRPGATAAKATGSFRPENLTLTCGRSRQA